MASQRPALWTVAGVVAAPVDAVWKALLAISPELKGQDVERLANAAAIERFTMALGDPSAGRMHVEVDSPGRRIATQGEWWYRGVVSVTAQDEGSLVIRQIYNVAPAPSRWLVRFVHHHDPVAFRREHQGLVEALGARLGCKVSLVD